MRCTRWLEDKLDRNFIFYAFLGDIRSLLARLAPDVYVGITYNKCVYL